MAEPSLLVVFDGREDGLMDKMSRKVAEGARSAGGKVLMITAGAARPDDLLGRDAVIIGTPCHFAGPSAAVKWFMDSTWGIRGKLAGKVGAAFTASEHLAGGHDFALQGVLSFFLYHGMIIEGDCGGSPFGPVLIAPDGDKSEALSDDPEDCRNLGARVIRLAKLLH